MAYNVEKLAKLGALKALALWPLLRCLLWLRTFWATSTT